MPLPTDRELEDYRYLLGVLRGGVPLAKPKLDDFLRYSASLLSAYEEQRKGWRPIETYEPPRVGQPEPVLTLDSAGLRKVARYIRPLSSRTPAWWASEPGRWDVRPTHWMPLPSPPDGGGE